MAPPVSRRSAFPEETFDRLGSGPAPIDPGLGLRRRGLIVGAVFGLVGGRAQTAWALGAGAAVFVVPEGRAQTLRRFMPAAGPLERHAARPGAWYALLELPVAPRWPLELLMWPAQRHHEIRLFALDAAPDEAPTVVDLLPLELDRGRGARASARVSRFMLPAGSTARTIFVLVEQWHVDGEAPAPLWVQLLAQRATQRTTDAPWWSAHAGRAVGAAPPPSPLTRQQRGPDAHEVPIFSTPAMPGTGVWR